MRSVILLCLFASTTTARPAPARPAPAKRWIAGDAHMHVAPPDTDVDLSVAEVARAAARAGLEWVVLTPHLWPSARGERYAKRWREMARDARAIRDVTLLPGIEWSTRDGHFTIAGVDVPSLGADPLASARARGGFVSVNHPFAVPTRIPGVPVSHYDLSYRAWSEPSARARRAPPVALDGVEVWNVPLGFANVVSRPGGATGEARAWLEADKLARTQRRRIATVGGTDNHRQAVMPTTWIHAVDASEASVLEALRTGATCVGGSEAGSLEARGAGDWVSIGGIVRGPRVELRWTGTAQLFVDGRDLGERTGGYVHTTAGVPHTYRIVVGASRCGFVYANL